MVDFNHLKNSEAVSFYNGDDMSVKGCQLFIQKSEGAFTIINLLDQDLNNVYIYRSTVVCVGSKKFELDSKDSQQYAWVISACLRDQYISMKIFENHEAFLLLRKATDKAL